MLSFYQKLASKLNENSVGSPQDMPTSAAAGKSASFKATGERLDSSHKPGTDTQSAAGGTNDPPPEGTEPLDIDLYQSDARMVIFAQMAGVAKDDFELTLDEESNTITIQAAQKHLALPPLPGAKEGDAAEKGRYLKQETKWKNLYRKVYLPAPFDSGEAAAFLDRGVLVIELPAKRPGAGKKLTVKEISDDARESQPEK